MKDQICKENQGFVNLALLVYRLTKVQRPCMILLTSHVTFMSPMCCSSIWTLNSRKFRVIFNQIVFETSKATAATWCFAIVLWHLKHKNPYNACGFACFAWCIAISLLFLPIFIAHLFKSYSCSIRLSFSGRCIIEVLQCMAGIA